MSKTSSTSVLTREALIEAASREIQLYGYQGANLDRILEATSVTKGALYHYFRGKKDLGYAVVEERIGPLIRNRWQPPLVSASDPILALESVLQHLSSSDDERLVALGCPLNNLAQEMSPLDDGFRRRTEEIFSDWWGAIAEALAAAQKRGIVRAELDPRSTAIYIVATIEGCFSLAKNAQSYAVLRSGFRSLMDYLQTLRTTKTTKGDLT